MREACRPVLDPELYLSVVDLGLFYGADVSPDGKHVTITMTLTSPMCPAGPQILGEVKRRAEALEGVEKVEVALVWEPPWNPAEMATEEVKDTLGIW